MRRSVRWMFLNRRTGHFTVAQWPNIPLSVFIVVSIARAVVRPMAGIESVSRVVADGALFVWAIDEIFRGVNPVRRILGLAVTIASCLALSL
jgi:hypothetical protein